MYLLDPTEGLSNEELMHHIWHVRLTPLQRAHVQHKAEARGCSWQDLFQEAFERYDIMMDDPVQREAWLCRNEEIERRREAPFGSDPLIEQGGDA